MDEHVETPKWYHRRWNVVLMLFLVVGPFGLPLLYRSPQFSKTWKIVITLVMVPYTWVLILTSIDSFHRAMDMAAQIQSQVK